MTYSIKRILVEFYEGKPIPVSDEEYMIVSTYAEQQLRTFLIVLEKEVFLIQWNTTTIIRMSTIDGI